MRLWELLLRAAFRVLRALRFFRHRRSSQRSADEEASESDSSETRNMRQFGTVRTFRSDTPSQTRPALNAALFCVGMRRQAEQGRRHSLLLPAQQRHNRLHARHARLDPQALQQLRASRHSPGQTTHLPGSCRKRPVPSSHRGAFPCPSFRGSPQDSGPSSEPNVSEDVKSGKSWQHSASPGEQQSSLAARKVAGTLRTPLAGNRDLRQFCGRHGGACLLLCLADGTAERACYSAWRTARRSVPATLLGGRHGGACLLLCLADGTAERACYFAWRTARRSVPATLLGGRHGGACLQLCLADGTAERACYFAWRTARRSVPATLLGGRHDGACLLLCLADGTAERACYFAWRTARRSVPATLLGGRHGGACLLLCLADGTAERAYYSAWRTARRSVPATLLFPCMGRSFS